MNPAREFRRFKAAAGAGRDKAHRSGTAEPSRPLLLATGNAEMAERVVSDVVVQQCAVRCVVPWRECGIPADDLCLLAMHGAAGQPGLGSVNDIASFPGVLLGCAGAEMEGSGEDDAG